MAEEKLFTCHLCDALCGLRLTVEDGRITRARGDDDDVFSGGHLCPKGAAIGELQHDPDRLRAPLRRAAGGGFAEVSWDEALGEAAARLSAVRERHGRDAIAYYLGNPVAHAHRLGLASQVLALALRTKNRFDPNSQDSNPRTFACLQMYGDPLAIPVPDVDRTSFLLLLGANPAASNGSMMSLGDPRRRLGGIRRRGGRIVLLDPRRTETAAWANAHHFLRPGADAALLLALLHVIFAEGRADEGALAAATDGLAGLRALAARFPPSRVEAACGLPAEAIAQLARDFSSAKPAVAYGRIGTCQNLFGPLANWLVEALNVVTDNFDREGGALFPAPAAAAGLLGRLLLPSRHGRFRSRVRGLPEYLGALPSAVLAEEMETPGPGQVRALVCLAGNPVLSTPNGARLGRALAGLDCVVAIDGYLNETSLHAHLILPPSTVLETGNYDLLMQGLAVRNLARYSPPALAQDPRGKDDWEIASELALRLLLPARAPHQWLARRLRRLPELLVDLLLRLGPYGLSLAKVAAAAHGLDLGPLTPSRGRRVRRPGGRVQLLPQPLVADVPRLEAWIDGARAGGLVLIGRRDLRSNNSWMHNLPSLAKGPDRCRLLLHPQDASRLGLADGAQVRVTSRTGAAVARLLITDQMMQGVASLPHGFGHAAAAATLRVAGALPGPSMNALTDELLVEPVLGTSVLNGVPIEVGPA